MNVLVLGYRAKSRKYTIWFSLGACKGARRAPLGKGGGGMRRWTKGAYKGAWTAPLRTKEAAHWSESIHIIREVKFKRVLRLQFWTYFTKCILSLSYIEALKWSRYDLPINRKLSFFVFWHETFFQSNLSKFCGKQTNQISYFKI